MKSLNLSLLTAALCALPVLCSAVVIGDFEGTNNLDGWETSPVQSSFVNLSTRIFGATVGDRSLRVANANTGYSWGTLRRNIVAEPEILDVLTTLGSTVTIDFRARPGEVLGSSLSLTFLVNGDNGGSNANEQMDAQVITVDNTTQSITFELTDSARAILANSNVRAFIGFSDNSDDTRVWFVDNIQALAPSTPPPPPPPTEGLDDYGGTLALSFDIPNNGFFRTHFHEGQWFLVTPQNHAYVSFGLNHFHPSYWRRRGDRLDNNVAHWEEIFGVPEWQTEAWNDAFYDHIAEISELVGANSLGYHNPEYQEMQDTRPQLYPYFRHFVPVEYSLHLTPGPEDYPDVFSQAFVDHCNALARTEVAPYVNDDMIIAWVCADVPFITERPAARSTGRYTWAMALRNLGPNLDGSIPDGKQAYMDFIQDRYSDDFAAFDQVYQVTPQITNWIQLRDAADWRPRSDIENDAEIEDQNLFNMMAIDKYYEVVKAAIRGVGANQLFAGDKIQANLPNLVELEQLVDTISAHSELIMYQFFGNNIWVPNLQTRTEDNIVAGTIDPETRPNGLPMLNGDSGFGFINPPYVDAVNAQRPTADSHEHRAEWITLYAEEAFSNVHCVGWHVCGVIDTYNGPGQQNGNSKPGIMDPWGILYEDEINALFNISESLYHLKGIE